MNDISISQNLIICLLMCLTLLIRADAARSMPYAQLNGISDPLNKGGCSDDLKVLGDDGCI